MTRDCNKLDLVSQEAILALRWTIPLTICKWGQNFDQINELGSPSDWTHNKYLLPKKNRGNEVAQENRTHHLTVTYFFSYRRLRHTIEVSNKPRFIKRNNKARKWWPHSAFASRHGTMGAHHWVLNVRRPHLGFIICQARKGLVPTINYVQPPLTSIMQRYRSSILFSNKQMFDQQSGRQRNIIAARKRKSPAPEWKPFLAQKKKKKHTTA